MRLTAFEACWSQSTSVLKRLPVCFEDSLPSNAGPFPLHECNKGLTTRLDSLFCLVDGQSKLLNGSGRQKQATTLHAKKGFKPSLQERSESHLSFLRQLSLESAISATSATPFNLFQSLNKPRLHSSIGNYKLFSEPNTGSKSIPKTPSSK